MTDLPIVLESKLSLACVASTALALVGCGGSGADAPAMPGPIPGMVTVSGTITFDRVPATTSGLAYADTRVAPARAVTVEIAASTGEILGSTVTDEDGRYALSAPENTDVQVRAKAEMLATGTPSWQFRVRDNVNGNALYTLEGSIVATGTANLTEDLHAASGWDGSSYAETRAAAPFAILDVAYDVAAFLLAVDATMDFPALDLFWSPDNVPELDANGFPDVATGEIGSSFYAAGEGIYLLGGEDTDTDEYDRHVIVHELAHYLENAFSRTDNIGGPHTLRDRLDLRVAFAEGFANALSAIVMADVVYRDVSGPGQSRAGGFDVEEGATFPPPVPGWFNERSVHEIIYDLFDDAQDSLEDDLTLGFAPLWEILRDEQRNTIAMTSIFSFIDALKANVPSDDVPAVDAIVGTQSIDTIVDIYGTNETNAAGADAPDELLPIYRDIRANLGAVNVCSTDEFTSAATGAENKLGSRQFLKFSVTAAGTHTIDVTATEVPEGSRPDPDWILHQAGVHTRSEGDPDDDLYCSAEMPLGCNETLSLSLGAGDYVLEVYEWTNTQAVDGEYPPIGRTCFDVRIDR